MLVELLAVILLASGIATRHIPDYYFNLYTSLINNTPLSITNTDTNAIYLLLFQHHFIHNILIWLLVFGSAQFILYYLRTLSPNKLNKKYPSNQLMFKECARSIRGVLIGTTIQVVVERLYVTKHLPLVSSKLSLYLEQSIHTQSSSFDITCCLLLGALIMMVIGETHFYFTHRLLHTTWLYQNVHKQHHESINPDPMSGLSMHWIESTIYFSTPFFIGLVSPLWLARLMTKALLITPIQGHSGFTTTIKGNAINDMIMNAGIDHYIHHAKFRYNFGANPFWDRLLGTEYPQDKKELLMNQFYASNKKDDAKDIVHSSGKKSNSILKSIVTYQFLLFGLFEFVSAVNWWNNSTKERKASNGLLPQESTTEVFVVGWCVYLVTLGLVRVGVFFQPNLSTLVVSCLIHVPETLFWWYWGMKKEYVGYDVSVGTVVYYFGDILQLKYGWFAMLVMFGPSVMIGLHCYLMLTLQTEEEEEEVFDDEKKDLKNKTI